MSQLGRHGQYGNMLIQYAFIRCFARIMGWGYEVPEWGQNYLFGQNGDPPVTKVLPEYREGYIEDTSASKYVGFLGTPVPPKREEILTHWPDGFDYAGWAQFHTSWYKHDERFIRSLYPVRRDVSGYPDRQFEGRTVIGLHLRRGDSGRHIFFFTPIVWCLKWLHENWRRFDNPLLFISTESPSLRQYFAPYEPVMAEDFGIKFIARPYPGYHYPYEVRPERARNIDFYPDWHLLRHCHVVLASESTFSFTAAWLSDVNCEFWRPRLSLQEFERVDPWNTDVSPREHLSDYPGIPGTQLDRNDDFPDAWRNYSPRFPSVPEDVEEIEHWMAMAKEVV